MAKDLGARLDRVELALLSRPLPGQFEVVRAIPVANAGGMTPGLYADGLPGLTAGLLVFDPAEGRPRVPEGRLAPWGLVIVCEGATIDTAG